MMKRTLTILAIFLCGLAIGDPIKSMLGADEFLEESGPTSSDYIQEGLVGVYDSIWNIGPDMSDDSGKVYDWFSGQESVGFVGYLFSKNSEVKSALSSSYKTVQFCLRGYRDKDGAQAIKYFLGSNSAAGFSLQSRLSSSKIPFIYQYCDGVEGKSDPYYSVTFFSTLTIVRDGDKIRYYHGDSLYMEKNVTRDPYNITYLHIDSPTEYFGVTPYRVAVYDRALSELEIKCNVLVDEMRFKK